MLKQHLASEVQVAKGRIKVSSEEVTNHREDIEARLENFN